MLESERIDAPKVELAAADFEGILLNGQPFRLSDQKGKVVFLNFWATWCSPCLKEMPDMQELQKELGSKILVLAVGMGEAAERIEKFQKKHQFEFQILPDPEHDSDPTLWSSQYSYYLFGLHFWDCCGTCPWP